MQQELLCWEEPEAADKLLLSLRYRPELSLLLLSRPYQCQPFVNQCGSEMARGPVGAASVGHLGYEVSKIETDGRMPLEDGSEQKGTP